MRITHGALAALLVLVACGPADPVATVAVTFDKDGLGEATTRASVIVVDANGASADRAAEAAGLSASESPESTLPLNVCRVIEGGTRGGGVADFHLLDPGAVTVTGPRGAFALTAQPPATGDGTGMTGSAPNADVPYEPGGSYSVQADGGEAPGFSVGFTAPPAFELERIGFASPGPGTLSVSTQAKLDIIWSPEADGTELYLLVDAGTVGLACRVVDDGEFEISKDFMSRLPLVQGRFAVERFEQSSFDTGFGGDDRQIPARLRAVVRRSYRIDLQ